MQSLRLDQKLITFLCPMDSFVLLKNNRKEGSVAPFVSSGRLWLVRSDSWTAAFTEVRSVNARGRVVESVSNLAYTIAENLEEPERNFHDIFAATQSTLH